jgi:beta-lactam-binding protein with PASTA domain
VKGLTANRLPGTVMEQEPAPGSRLAPGTKVHLVIAEKPAEPEKIPEPELVAAPHLVGLSQESARAALKKAWLVMGKIKQVESREAKPGTVIEQIPPSGRQLIKGNTVTLVVAVEPPSPLLVAVPKLGGLTVEMAREALAREGLTTGAVQQKASSRSRPGAVIDQKPRPGQQVKKGTAVELVLATASAETGPVATPAPGKITVIAQGEPTSRRSWEGVKKPAYSAQMARLYSGILKESASGSIEQTINTYSEHEMRVLEKMLRDPKRLCESTGSDIVFAARIQETYANSELESAYWPELRQTAIVCNSGKQYEQRNNLSPGRTDQFPFETGMTNAMQTFAKEHRQLLK